MKLKVEKEIIKLSLMSFFLNLFFLGPVIVFFFQQRGLDYFQILSLESILVLFIFLFEVPTGIFADKFGRKKSIILGAFINVTNIVIFLFANSFVHFALAYALSGISIAFFSGTIEALIYDYLKQKNKKHLMKQAMGTYGAITTMASVIAPVIGSYLAKDLLPSQFTLLLYLTLGMILIGFVISLLIEDSRKKDVVGENPFIMLKEGIELLWQNKSLLRIVLLNVFSSPFIFTIMYLVQPYFKMSDVNVAFFGTITSVALLLSAFAQKYAYKIEKIFGIKRGVFLVTFLPGVLYLFMSFVFHPIWSVVLFIFLRAIIEIRYPIFSDYKNIHIPEKIRATVLSLISQLSSFYLMIMRLIIGKLSEYNLSYSFIFMGLVVMAASIYFRIGEDHVECK
ncbi:hypothetical protein BBF96_02630 [Anoxybacter fermentans]|uniref:Major facilitator superfamily (MFS) profile domain-containing protein n=1 Tax=Anoxybacter fermentans TaxID=1323375 RepID=A0A3S9SVP6_9FIRM|nr:MFS transporter [Anoxybacter fermentans]AZR72386.1 hypothetical protein BBF96_02630 [Anoxybacter fermentans]